MKIVPDPDNYEIILRFMGTTPSTSNILPTFQSVIHQLAKIFNMNLTENRFTTNDDVRDYLFYQLSFLASQYKEKKIVIFLDSIDQLNPSDYNLNWMITEIPENVKIIFSTLPEHEKIFETLRTIFKNHSDIFMEVCSLNQSIVKTIIEDWLEKRNRSLSEPQWKVLDETFANATLYPLYVKLIFDIVIKWESYFIPTDEFKNLLQIDNCIEYLFKQLEKNHGEVLFSRSMFYMTTFKNGISESELEDILSIDDDVLYSIFEYHAPPVRRFPIALWARIKHDLEEYMVQKEIDDTRVIYWYHRRFIEVGNSVYVSRMDETQRETVFNNVIDFFNETWKHKPKPYKYTDHVAKKKKLASDTQEETRNTAMQAIEIVAEDGTVRYNKRKLTELPGFISQMNINFAAPLACEHVFFNYTFLHAYFQCCDLSSIIKNLTDTTSSYAISDEVQDSVNYLKFLFILYLECRISMKDYPDSIAVQLLSRLLKFYGCNKYLSNFIDQCDELSNRHCALVAPYQSLQPPGIGVLFNMDRHTKGITCTLAEKYNGYLFITVSDKIVVLSLSYLNALGEIPLMKLDKNDYYKHLKVYCEDIPNYEAKMKNIFGKILVASQHVIQVVDFNSKILFSKVFEDLEIQNVEIVGPNHFVLSFKNCNFFELYSIKNGKVLLRKSLEQKIKFMLTNTHIHFVDSFLYEDCSEMFNVLIMLENSQINIFELKKSEDENETAESFDIKDAFVIPSPGVDCVDFTCFSTAYYGLKYCVSFADGSVGIFEYLNDRKCIEMKLMKPKVNELNSNKTQIMLKILDSQYEITLFLGENRALYVFSNDEGCKIEGVYDNGRIWIMGDSIVIGVRKGVYDIFIMSKDNEKKNFKITKMHTFDVHFNDITFISSKGFSFFSLKLNKKNFHVKNFLKVRVLYQHR